MTATLGALTQSLEQIARWNLDHTEWARHDNGDFAAGAADARATAFLALEAARALDQAGDAVMAAHSAAGRIAWEPDPARTVRRSLAEREHDLEAGPRSSPEAPGAAGRSLG